MQNKPKSHGFRSGGGGRNNSLVITVTNYSPNNACNSIMYNTPTQALFCSTLYYSSVLISLKYIKVFNGTPTCFDLKRSSSESMTVPC